jgi:hypothetical protein
VPASWEAFYKSDAQGVWSLVVLPTAFLVWLAVRGKDRDAPVEPAAAGFVRAWAVVFAVVALVDPIATGLLGWPLLPFVLLGDYRVLALALVVMQPGRARASALAEAAAWTLVVPAIAWSLYRARSAAAGPLPESVLWLLYEVAFFLLAVVFAAWLVRRRVGLVRTGARRYVRAVLALVAGYYALWATSDVLTIGGRDWGWALRVVPNQLYYGVLVPAAYVAFFRSASTSASTQTAR